MRLRATRQPQRGDLRQRRLPLDFLPFAAAGFALRRLRWDYFGAAIRVRRSSDNAELDIGFNANGDLDTVRLLAFCGAGSGFVTTWYDQGLFARHATQGNPANQPRIVNAGAVDALNGKPCLVYNSSSMSFPATSLREVSAVVKQTSIGAIAGLIGSSGIDNGIRTDLSATDWRQVAAPTDLTGGAGGFIRVSGAQTNANSPAPIGGIGLAEHTFFAQFSTAYTPATSWEFGGYFAGRYINAYIPEILTVEAILSASGIEMLERNQGAYYGIAVA